MNNTLMSFKEKINFLFNSPSNRWILWASAIIVLSVKIISNAYSMNFSSETALHVLMMDDFEFLRDNFIWGETYLGSLFPMIGSFIKIFFDIPSLYLSTILQYAFLILLYVVVCKTFISNNTARVFLALLVFIPPAIFAQQVYTGYSYLSSFPPFFVGLYYLLKFLEDPESEKFCNYISLYLFFSFLAGWVLEFFIFFTYLTSFILIFYVCYLHVSKMKNLNLKYLLSLIVFGNILIFFTMKYLRICNRSQYYQDGYGKLNKFEEMFIIVKTYFNFYFDALAFKGNPSTVVFAYSFLILFVYLSYCLFVYLKNTKQIFDIKLWFLIYFLGAYTGAIILSNWNYFLGVQIKYLIPAYFVFGVLALYVYSKYLSTVVVKNRIFGNVLIGFYFVSGSFTGVSFIIHSGDTRVSAHSINQQLIANKVQDKYFYGGYYHAHKLSGATSGIATATVSGKMFGNFRNFKMRNKVMENPEVYVIPNGLFIELPDTIHDYGVNLVKSNERPIYIDAWDATDFKKDGYVYDKWILKKYINSSVTKYKYSKVFYGDDLLSWVGKKELDREINKDVWMLDLNKLGDRQAVALVFGRLEMGKYKCNIQVSISDTSAIEEGKPLQLNIKDQITDIGVWDISIPKKDLRNGYFTYTVDAKINVNSDIVVASLTGDKTNKPCLVKVRNLEFVKSD